MRRGAPSPCGVGPKRCHETCEFESVVISGPDSHCYLSSLSDPG